MSAEAIPPVPQNTILTTDYQAEYSSHNTWNTLNKLAAIASAVALVALAAAAIVFTYLLQPIYLPITFTAILAFAIAPGYSAFSFFWNNARGHSEGAKELQGVVDELNDLKGKDLRYELHRHKLIKVPEDSESLRNGLAFYRSLLVTIEKTHTAYKKMFGAFETDSSELLTLRSRAEDGKPNEIKVKVSDYMGERAEFYNDAQKAPIYRAVLAHFIQMKEIERDLAFKKLLAAYTLHVLNNPEAKDIEKLCTPVPLSAEKRLMKNEFDQYHGNTTQVFYGADGSRRMTTEKLMEHDVEYISQKIFG